MASGRKSECSSQVIDVRSAPDWNILLEIRFKGILYRIWGRQGVAIKMQEYPQTSWQQILGWGCVSRFCFLEPQLKTMDICIWVWTWFPICYTPIQYTLWASFICCLGYVLLHITASFFSIHSLSMIISISSAFFTVFCTFMWNIWVIWQHRTNPPVTFC